MRVIGKLSNDLDARKFSAFLTRQGIENRLEGADLWIADEDRINEASEYLRRFEANPSDPLFEEPFLMQMEERLAKEPVKKQHSAIVTSFFLALCAFVYFINLMQEIPMREEGLSEQTILLTPIQSALLFDLPAIVDRFEKFVVEHEIKPSQKMQDLSPALRSELEDLEKTPYWRGAYDWVLLKCKKQDTRIAEGPLFEKIRQGQIWRLFTPAILHRDLLHILFNMIWLWVLGRPIEQRIGPWRTLVLTLIAGVGSNAVQYLMSGPFFLGYSGVVMGLAGFIWMRERIAPWEGYPLPKGTIMFLYFFILAMFALQTLSFLVQVFSDLPFILSIANTAHIVGAAIGILFGRLSSFAWRIKT